MEKKMKNSGIEWVGDIPEHWETHPIYYYFGERKHKNSLGKENNLLSLSYGKVIRKDIATTEGLLPENYNGYNIVEKGDIVLRLTDLQNDKRSLRTGLVKEKGILTSAYVTLRPIKEECSLYFHYLLHAYDIMKVFYNMGNGVRQGLNFDELSKCMLIAPPISEQKAIAGFLDKKCGEVDALIADIQQEIETLEQYKRSVITEAVTKGLDPSVPMKESGVGWMPTIPAHWVVHPLYYYFEERKNKNIFAKEHNLLSLSYGKIIRKDINANGGLLPENFNAYNIVEPKDIVLRLTDLQNDKRSLRTGFVNERGIITSAYITLRAKKDIMQEYFYYELHVFDLLKGLYNMGSGVRQGLNFDELSKLKLFEPTMKEQMEIVAYIKEKEKKIEEIISDKQSQIETLESYKKSLIYEYVTGKKEVIA